VIALSSKGVGGHRYRRGTAPLAHPPVFALGSSSKSHEFWVTLHSYFTRVKKVRLKPSIF